MSPADLSLAQKREIIDRIGNGFDTVQSIAVRMKLPRDTVRDVIAMVRG